MRIALHTPIKLDPDISLASHTSLQKDVWLARLVAHIASAPQAESKLMESMQQQITSCTRHQVFKVTVELNFILSSSLLLCGCYVRECIIFQIKLVSCGQKVQLILFALGYAEIGTFYVHSEPLSIETTELIDNSDSQSETSQRKEAPTSPKRTKTKPVTPHARGGYKASFEACFVDLVYK